MNQLQSGELMISDRAKQSQMREAVNSNQKESKRIERIERIERIKKNQIDKKKASSNSGNRVETRSKVQLLQKGKETGYTTVRIFLSVSSFATVNTEKSTPSTDILRICYIKTNCPTGFYFIFDRHRV